MDVPIRHNYPFRGWDYTELAKAWNLPLDEDYNSERDAELTRLYLEAVVLPCEFRFTHNRKFVIRRHANDIRAYCMAMAKNLVGPVEIWKGFTREESDFEVISAFARVLEIAWT